jgi:hypothetical protein
MFEHWLVASGVGTVIEEVKGFAHLHPSRWRVLAVFPDPTSSTVSVPILEALGFKGGVKSQIIIEGVDFVYIPEGRSKEDTAVNLRNEIAKGDVLLVVGHVTSTVAQYLDQTVYTADDIVGSTPMPLILPAATTPQLTVAQPKDQEHILRLPATDLKQVQCLLTFITRMMADKANRQEVSPDHEATVGVIRDGSNPTYSDYIGDELVAQADAVDQSVGASLGGSDIPMNSVLDHDVVVIPGMERLSKVFLRRLHRRKIPIGTSPEFVFTDGVAGEVFYKATADFLRDPSTTEHLNQHVWMSGPFQPQDRGGAMTKKGDPMRDKPDYYSYGQLAGTVARELLEDTERRHHGKVSRALVLDTVRVWLKKPSEQPAGVSFDAKGDNQLPTCHVFRIGAGTYAHSKYCCCDSTN